jgi:glutamate 5-kinase
VDGLYTKADASGTLIKRVSKIDEKISSYAGKTQSERSVGGMISKIEAAKLVMEKQIPMVIAHGRTPDILITLGKGKSVGTHFHASPKR